MRRSVYACRPREYEEGPPCAATAQRQQSREGRSVGVLSPSSDMTSGRRLEERRTRHGGLGFYSTSAPD